MQHTMTIGAAGALAIVLATLGCTSDPEPIVFPLTSPPRPIAPVKTVRPLPPAVYDVEKGVAPIPKDLEEKLSEAVTLSTPAGERVWFLKIEGYAAQMGKPGKPWYNVSVYFRPHTSTPRLRRGKCTTCLARPHDYADANRAEYRVWRGAFTLAQLPYLSASDRRRETTPGDYVQVSPTDEPFADRPDVPATDTAWPFLTSGELTDEEIVAIVDFVRRLPPETRRVTPPLPIFSVSRSDRGQIEVLTGALHRTTPGKRAGEMFTLQPTDGTYKIIAVW